MIGLIEAANIQPDYVAPTMVLVLAVIGIIILATKLVNYLFSE